MEYRIKPFEDLAFHDDFMFGIVMQDRELCREALECMLGMGISRIEYTEPQRAIAPLYSARGIRLDVYVQDGNRVYDVEIQNRDQKDLGRRTRYYQSVMDTDQLLRGRPYSGLGESIIIFLCRFDPFQRGIPCYTIRRTCMEDAGAEIDDGAAVYVFNCQAYGKEKDPKLRAFLKYVQTDSAESDLTRRLEAMVEAQKAVEGGKKVYLSWSLHDYDVRREGREEGLKEGASSARLENARNLLSMKLGTHEQIAQAVGLPLEEVEKLARQTD